MLILAQYADGNTQGTPQPISTMVSTTAFQDGDPDDVTTWVASATHNVGGNVLAGVVDLGAGLPAITTITAMVDSTQVQLYYSDDGRNWFNDTLVSNLTVDIFQKVSMRPVSPNHRYWCVQVEAQKLPSRIADIRLYNGSAQVGGDPPRTRPVVMVY